MAHSEHQSEGGTGHRECDLGEAVRLLLAGVRERDFEAGELLRLLETGLRATSQHDEQALLMALLMADASTEYAGTLNYSTHKVRMHETSSMKQHTLQRDLRCCA